MRKKGRKTPDAIVAREYGFSGALACCREFAAKAYSKIPQFSFMDRQTVAILLLSILAYSLFVAYFFIFSPKATINVETFEGPLKRNSDLMILPGETYAYEFFVQGAPVAIRYFAKTQRSCSGTYIVEEYAGQAEGYCLGKDGKMSLEYGGENRSIILFSPWMLALEDGFSWRVEKRSEAGGIVVRQALDFAVVGRKTVMGRDAFEVRLSSDSGLEGNATMYIDSEKRVLLVSTYGTERLGIVSAPFDIDMNDSTFS